MLFHKLICHCVKRAGKLNGAELQELLFQDDNRPRQLFQELLDQCVNGKVRKCKWTERDIKGAELQEGQTCLTGTETEERITHYTLHVSADAMMSWSMWHQHPE